MGNYDESLNNTGKPIFLAIHPQQGGNSTYPKVANMWRTGGDLSASSYDMWLNRLDLATDPKQSINVGPGAIANPDFLEVGYTPRQPKSSPNVQTIVERRSMFTMWAAYLGLLCFQLI